MSSEVKPEVHDVICFCGSPMVLRWTKKFKGGQYFYGCNRYPKCDGTHGCHQATGAPLGIPANKETKSWRIKAHESFDALWKGKEPLMSRLEAYAWISHRLGFEVHMGEATIETCQKVIAEVENELKGRSCNPKSK